MHVPNQAGFASALSGSSGDVRPRFDFTAGPVCYTETLEQGRLLGQGWSALGQRPEVAAAGTWRDLPADSFQLVIDGQDTRRGWKLAGVTTPDDTHSVIALEHDRLPVAVKVHTRVDPLGVMARWLEVENCGNEAIGITHAASWSGMLHRNLSEPNVEESISQFEVGRYLHHNWALEGRFAWEPLPFGTLTLGAMRGTSGWGGPPLFMLRRHGFDETFVGSVAWSSPWSMSLMYDPFPRYSCVSFSAGPAAASPQRVLEPGERTATPRMYLAYLRGDADTVTQTLHEYLRRRVAPPRRARSVPMFTYNSWGDFKQLPEEPALIRSIETAAEMGAEMYVLDAGWFGRNKGSYAKSCGDWTPGEWIPNGLEPISKRIHDLGMKFGLWVAFTMIGSGSKLLEDHPDWNLRVEGRANAGQLKEDAHPAGHTSLDLCNPQIMQWLHQELDRVVGQYQVDMLRTDGGPTSHEGGYRRVGRHLENILWRYDELYNQVIDRLRAKYPNLLIDNCIGGGGKLDLAMYERSEITWTSDNYHVPVESIRTLNAVTLLMPPEYCTRLSGAIVRGADMNDPRVFAYSLRIPMLSQWCLSGIPAAWREGGAEKIKLIRKYIDLYKSFVQPMMADCRVYHHTPSLVGRLGERPPCCVLEYGAADRNRSIIGAFRLDPGGPNQPPVRPRGLNPARTYRVTFDSTGETRVETGEKLAGQGVVINMAGAYASELLLMEAV